MSELPSADFLWILFFGLIGAIWVILACELLRILRLMPIIQPKSVPTDSQPPLISVIIPAKNEEKNIRTCIESLQAQDYPNYEIIVVNDNSTDQTEEILKMLHVRYINNTPTPEGWTGKNFALHNGISYAHGDWFLFTDADTYHEKFCLSSIMQHIQQKNLQFLTLLPRCLAISFFENLLQPLAMAFIGLWFPIPKINDPNSPVYFGNGQFLMMSRDLYQKTGGHDAVKGAFLEDFALCKKSKEAKARVECALGEKVYGTRMYDSLDAIWRGWRRIYLHAFQSKTEILLRKATMVLMLSFMPFAGLLLLLLTAPHSTTAWILGLGVPVFIYILSWRTYAIVHAKQRFAFLLPLGAVYISLILLDAARMAATKAKTVWR